VPETEIDNLPDDPAALKLLLKKQVRLANAQASRLRFVEGELELAKSRLYGKKSEKLTEAELLDAFLFNEAEEALREQPTKTTTVRKHSRKRRGKRKPLPSELPRKEVIHDLDDKDKVCGCGHELKRIGEEVSEKLDVIPAKYIVQRHIRPKYACPECNGEKDSGPTVKVAPPAPSLYPGTIIGNGLGADIIVSKYCDHIPLHRYEKIMKRMGVDLPRSTMARFVIKATQHPAFADFVKLLEAEVLSQNLIGIDETRLQVLKEKGRSATAQSFMWVMRSFERPVILFRYQPTRSAEWLVEFLQGYIGTIQTDGYASYQAKLGDKPDIKHAGCWAHARRKFDEAKKVESNSPAATQALGMIAELYAIEEQVKVLSPNARLKVRQERSKTVIDKLYAWLAKKQMLIPQKTAVGKAVLYCLGQWKYLTLFLDEPEVRLDNNMVENAIRPFALGRKNWLFSDSTAGAQASGVWYSILETAKAHKLEPYWYIRHLLAELPKTESTDDLRRLLPWNLDHHTLYKRHRFGNT